MGEEQRTNRMKNTNTKTGRTQGAIASFNYGLGMIQYKKPAARRAIGGEDGARFLGCEETAQVPKTAEHRVWGTEIILWSGGYDG